jgi:molybdopterin synthase sulfur carrier subunit
MPLIAFTQQLRRFTDAPELQTESLVLRAALEEVFLRYPRLRGYVLDDQSHLRTHVVIFIDGQRVRDRVRLDDALQATSRVHVLQALSGG